MKKTAARKVTAEMTFSTSAWRMNGMSRLDPEEFHDGSLWWRGPPQTLADTSVPGFHTWPMDTLLSFFWRPYQRLTRPRENTTAENIEVRMPRQCTMAKPRTGPEPKASSATPAMSVVMLESRIVAQACS